MDRRLAVRSEDSKRAVIAARDAFASRDPQRISAVFAEDAEWIAPMRNATALATGFTDHMVGPSQIARFIAFEFGTLFSSDVKVEFRGVYAEDDIVIVEERMQARLSNGNHYDNDYCFVFEVEDGLIKRVREYMDTAKGHRMIFGERGA
jgi:ketosteroid isomerase-like protein